jgi:hypothetical protein
MTGKDLNFDGIHIHVLELVLVFSQYVYLLVKMMFELLTGINFGFHVHKKDKFLLLFCVASPVIP